VPVVVSTGTPAVVVVPTGLAPLATVGAGLATLAAVIVVVAGGPGGGMAVVAPGVGAELAVRLQKRGGDFVVDGGDARRCHEGDDN